MFSDLVALISEIMRYPFMVLNREYTFYLFGENFDPLKEFLGFSNVFSTCHFENLTSVLGRPNLMIGQHQNGLTAVSSTIDGR